MGRAAFEQGQWIELNEKKFLLLRKVDSDIWQAEEIRSKRIYEFSDEKLRNEYAKGNLRFISFHNNESNDKTPSARPYREIQTKLMELAKIRRSYVKSIIDIPSSKNIIQPIIKKLWEKLKCPSNPPGASSVLRWKKIYLASGEDINSLVDRVQNRGNSTPRYPEQVNDYVDQAIERIYLTRERKTVQDTLDHAKWLVAQENKLRPRNDHLPLPTRKLVQRKINAMSAYDRTLARYGSNYAAKKFRSVLHSKVVELPLQRAEIDHTLLDIFVIDDKSNLPLGRPWITVCIDNYTRSILGFHISFDPPSYLNVARCLKHSFLPKTDLSRISQDLTNSWDAHGVMQELVVDNGMEFHSESLEALCFSLGIEIHYSPRKTPWYKGKIERFLGTLNRGVSHGTPGTTFSNIFDKDDYDPAKHAVLHLNKLTEIITIWIVDVYHQKPHRALHEAPAALWKSSISLEQIMLPEDPSHLDAILGRVEKRVLTHKGIELDSLFYNSAELTELRMQKGDKLNVEIRIDDSNLGSIIVLSPDKHRIFVVPAVNKSYADGLTRWQHKVCKKFSQQYLNSQTSNSWIEAKNKISEIIESEMILKKTRTYKKAARFTGQPPLNPDNTLEPKGLSEAHENLALNKQPVMEKDPKRNPEENPDRAKIKYFEPIYRQRSRHAVIEEQNKG